MNKPLATVAALLATALLAGCGNGSPEDPKGSDTETNSYRGEKVTCIKTSTGDSRTLTCDFDRFYADHPTLLTNTTKDVNTADVWWTDYRDQPMPCFREGSGRSTVMSCDFTWYAALAK